MKLIIKKETYENVTSFKQIIEAPKIICKILKLYWKIRGYEVEVIENE